MKWLIDALYELVPFDKNFFDFYDMHYLLTSPNIITFCRKDKRYNIKVSEEDGGVAIEFEGKWFRDRDEFFAKAEIDRVKLTSIYDELFGFWSRVMDIIKVANGDYGRYEELLLQKEQLEKEAYRYHQDYINKFGELINKVFAVKIECIALKKKIAYCQSVINRGLAIDEGAMGSYVNEQMRAYYNQLEEMVKEFVATKDRQAISAYEAREVKRIYREIAKILHPDISSLTKDYPELADLYQRAMIAYKCNDLNDIREAEALINKALKDIGVDKLNIEIPNVAEKIIKLEDTINRVLTTEPYTYKGVLENKDKCDEKNAELNAELEEYINYGRELLEHLNELTGK